MPEIEWGDFDDDDAFSTEPADPEQVAIKLHRLREREGIESMDWDDLDRREKDILIVIMGRLLSWLHRQGSG